MTAFADELRSNSLYLSGFLPLPSFVQDRSRSPYPTQGFQRVPYERPLYAPQSLELARKGGRGCPRLPPLLGLSRGLWRSLVHPQGSKAVLVPS